MNFEETTAVDHADDPYAWYPEDVEEFKQVSILLAADGMLSTPSMLHR